jgi:predicted nuclease of predicted toxin-antitoxin system
VKVVIDMNMSTRWVEALRAEGLDATHWSDVGHPEAADTEIMQFAAANDYVVLTRDMDFSAILAATVELGPSVVQLRRQDRFSPDFARHVAAGMQQVEPELAAGAVLSIDGGRMRLRRLPIGTTDGTP